MQMPSFNCTYFCSITQSEILVFFTKASPYVRFNKNGTLLAVSVDQNSIKILANDGGRIFLQTSLDASTYLSTREVCMSNLIFFSQDKKNNSYGLPFYCSLQIAGNSLSGPANSSPIDGIVPPVRVERN